MSHQLTIEPLGQTLDVEEGQTILDAALRAGIFLPHACCHGLCATCKIVVTDGEVDHGEASNFALMDYEREEGQALASGPEHGNALELLHHPVRGAKNGGDFPASRQLGTVEGEATEQAEEDAALAGVGGGVAEDGYRGVELGDEGEV